MSVYNQKLILFDELKHGFDTLNFHFELLIQCFDYFCKAIF